MTKIFVVDDEPSYRDSLELILAYENYDVRTAADGSAAIEAAGSFAPDVLIVDWMLRDDMNGIDLAKTILQSSPEMRTIVISGYTTPWLIDQVESIAGAELLEKPFGIDDLLDTVGRVVG